MPYRDRTAERLAARERKRRQRARQREAKRRATVLPFPVPADPVGELVAWSRDVLKVPPGHPMAGRPMALPDFAVDFLRAGWDAHESACAMARKQGKSAICAVLALGFLVGPLRRSRMAGRGGVRLEGEGRGTEDASRSHRARVRARRAAIPARALSGHGGVEHGEPGDSVERSHRGA